MRPAFWAAVLACSLVSTAPAQDVRQSNDWKKMYEDASTQLRAAQNRKSELATDNAKLTARVAELQTQLQSAQLAAENLRRQVDADQEQTRMLQAFYAGWDSFTRRRPVILDQWRAYWGQDIPGLPDNSLSLLSDPQWPLTLP
jgi:septal ring factor EnvC (AmiA/AmiB activator)